MEMAGDGRGSEVRGRQGEGMKLKMKLVESEVQECFCELSLTIEM
jgi:hypothetical protein